MSEEAEILHFPVRVAPIATSTDSDLEKINRLTLEPLASEDIFTFSGICSNDNMDSYFTRMDPNTTLKNYVEDLRSGVALQEGHNIWINPYGRSYDGQMEANSVRGFWYIVRNMMLNGNNTDDMIRAIQSGIIKDMSVGFGGDDIQYICSADGQDLYDTPYWPGDRGPDGQPVFFWIKNARLREVSTVYKGSCPGAYIDKARAYAQQGELDPKKMQQLERRYNIRLDDGKRRFYMPKPKGENSVGLLDEVRTAIRENKIEKRAVYDVLAAEGETFRQPDDIAIRNELGEQATVEGVRALKKEAEQGRAYVADLIDQAVQSRVRAQGDKFNADAYKQMLARSGDIGFIKDEINSYQEMTKDRFTPGRQTNPDDPGTRGANSGDAEDVIVSEKFKGDDE
ncbi:MULTISPECIES: hypothetical protein [Heyndrickxia]|uniref:hypothetical protein n=1 Tax=Heyndrickxia TaxID=2837504 RepID=UPI000551F8D4|nr:MULTISPECIES: hypothetical protein [Heyndrickxia]KGT40030.1 hypothetical protein P421_00110 [Heyndrickxia coagulans P38]MED4922112.1 hypothetical protein [Weizmannia sp. CD-2023]